MSRRQVMFAVPFIGDTAELALGVSQGGIGTGVPESASIALGIGVGLVVGKPLGVVLFSWLAVRVGLASLPRGVSWGGVLVVGCVAGIGVTMALFIAAMAFSDASMLSIAKLAVLLASAVAGTVAVVAGIKVLPVDQESAATGTISGDAPGKVG